LPVPAAKITTRRAARWATARFGTVSVERLGEGSDREGRQHDSIAAGAGQRRLQRQRVDHRGQHAHLVAGDPVESRGDQLGAAEDVASADDQANLDPVTHQFGDLAGNAIEDLGFDAAITAPGERLTAELQQDAPVAVGHARCLRATQPPWTWAITSAAKFSCFFSMPSPTS
jgi:hypothetical protein